MDSRTSDHADEERVSGACPRHGDSASRVVAYAAGGVRYVTCGMPGCGRVLMRIAAPKPA